MWKCRHLRYILFLCCQIEQSITASTNNNKMWTMWMRQQYWSDVPWHYGCLPLLATTSSKINKSQLNEENGEMLYVRLHVIFFSLLKCCLTRLTWRRSLYGEMVDNDWFYTEFFHFGDLWMSHQIGNFSRQVRESYQLTLSSFCTNLHWSNEWP